ncbi:MAG: response regulator [Acidobacteria bacterium]|nr:response regulator [Acidobacteriota bacterium]
MRIFIADDSVVVRRGLRSILSTENAWIVCGEASDGTSAMEKTRELKPDLVLLESAYPT